MEPKSFSATAMQTADACMARYQAENIDYARGIGNTAANLGTSCHDALENYVKKVYLDKTDEKSLKLLLALFDVAFMKTFNTVELSGEDYDDGVAMLKAWFKRDSLGEEGRTVVSCEVKTNFPINTSIGPIPFNYIWDRFDQIGPTEYVVVDYKTNRWGISPSDLRDKIQARAYALAAQIQHPEATKIWVEFDMLRHDGPVGIVFTRDENIATWKFLKATAEKIIATPRDKGKETLNDTCLFCVRKASCKALMANVKAGGIFSIDKPQEAVDRRAELDFQKKAIMAALKELDGHILAIAKEVDVTEFESEFNKLTIGVRSTRAIDAEMAAMVLGDALFGKYGGRSMTIGTVEKLLKGDELDAAKKKQLSSLIYKKPGEPSVTTKPKASI